MYWYEEEVLRLEKERAELACSPSTLFYGSSSVRLWQTLQEDFREYRPVNLGFGGSTLAACVWFFERTVAPYSPDCLVLYAGDNDLGDGRHPEEVLIFFQQFVARARQRFGDRLPCYFVSLKPSPSRRNLLGEFSRANRLIQTEILGQHGNWRFINIYDRMLDTGGQPKDEFFEEDGLHMNAKGYELWTRVIRASIAPAAQSEAQL
ncbi:GDSL-type esterase/lipase family protein [Pontibacter harenae]|uniref:GDSL-type esterase/lipase family protein n=1 Tax=Pontibacter harenae TaxID=2894083 RepID=UPI001E40B04F|nr:GDSL-type esterase/lipase family protein [Pontibacter harenae]MCC9167917.1 GDSL-type esterase/lipase family protein [Pontibacter harenae]